MENTINEFLAFGLVLGLFFLIDIAIKLIFNRREFLSWFNNKHIRVDEGMYLVKFSYNLVPTSYLLDTQSDAFKKALQRQNLYSKVNDD